MTPSHRKQRGAALYTRRRLIVNNSETSRRNKRKDRRLGERACTLAGRWVVLEGCRATALGLHSLLGLHCLLMEPWLTRRFRSVPLEKRHASTYRCELFSRRLIFCQPLRIRLWALRELRAVRQKRDRKCCSGTRGAAETRQAGSLITIDFDKNQIATFYETQLWADPGGARLNTSHLGVGRVDGELWWASPTARDKSG